MQIVLDDLAGPRLDDAANFRDLKVVACATQDAQWLADAAKPLGRAEGTAHVYLDPSAIKALAGHDGEDLDWQKGFATMISYAADHGWVERDGAIRAHVEWQG